MSDASVVQSLSTIVSQHPIKPQEAGHIVILSCQTLQRLHENKVSAENSVCQCFQIALFRSTQFSQYSVSIYAQYGLVATTMIGDHVN